MQCGDEPAHTTCGGEPAHTTCGGEPAHTTCGDEPAHTTCGGEPAHTACGGEPAHTTCGGEPAHTTCGGEPAHHFCQCNRPLNNLDTLPNKAIVHKLEVDQVEEDALFKTIIVPGASIDSLGENNFQDSKYNMSKIQSEIGP